MQKADLGPDTNPFIKTFGVGVSYEGYWNAFQMSIQFEDVHDIMATMYPDCDIEYYFDHSSCHDKGLKDGLNVNNMNTGYGGAQTHMRDTVLTDGCVGPYIADHILSVGDTQCMVFKEEDVGPFWMTPEERLENKHDRLTGEVEIKPKPRSMMLQDIARAGLQLPRRRFSADDLRTFAAQHGLATTYVKQKKESGWVNQPKGMLQVLWERGFIDPANYKKYTKDGPKGANGKRDKNFSLVHLLSECPDFENELTALQHLGKKLGTEVICTPKYHAEMAGEGVEYCWALAKNWYKRLPLKERKTREQFEAKVKEAFSLSVLSKEKVRGAARRQRSYILAYAHLHKEEAVDGAEGAAAAKEFVDIEKISKICRVHRAADDFDAAYIKQLENE